jgi:hypothetical protein
VGSRARQRPTHAETAEAGTFKDQAGAASNAMSSNRANLLSYHASDREAMADLLDSIRDEYALASSELFSQRWGYVDDLLTAIAELDKFVPMPPQLVLFTVLSAALTAALDIRDAYRSFENSFARMARTYGIVAWAFDDEIPNPSERVLDLLLSRGHPVAFEHWGGDRRLEGARRIWREESQRAVHVLDTFNVPLLQPSVRHPRWDYLVAKEQALLRLAADGDRQALAVLLWEKFAGRLRGTVGNRMSVDVFREHVRHYPL